MTLTKAIPIRNAAPTPLDGRLADMALLVCNSDGSPRTGVLGNASATIVTTTATMNLAVAAAEFATSKGKADGVSIFTNNGVVNVPVSAAPGSNSRIDVLWVKQNDDTTGDADALPTFGVTAGVAAALPVKPAIPTGAEELATLRIYSGTTATNGGSNVLTNTYKMTAARGGIVPFRTKDELDAWTNPVTGQHAFVESGDESYEWTGSAWILLLRPLGTWSPTVTGLTVGNGTLTAQCEKRGRIVEFFIEFVAGSTSNATGTVGFTLPFAPADAALMHRYLGEGLFRLATGDAFPVRALLEGSSTLRVGGLDASGSSLAVGSRLSNAWPTGGAWGDVTWRPKLYLHGTYLAAS